MQRIGHITYQYDSLRTKKHKQSGLFSQIVLEFIVSIQDKDMLLKDPKYIQPGSVEYPNGAFMPEEAIVTTAELRRLAGSLGADVPDFAENFTSLADKVDANSELPRGQDVVQFGDGTRRNYASLLIRFVADHPGALHVIRVKNFPPSEKLTAALVEGTELSLKTPAETGSTRPSHLSQKIGATIFKTARLAGTFRRAA